MQEFIELFNTFFCYQLLINYFVIMALDSNFTFIFLLSQ